MTANQIVEIIEQFLLRRETGDLFNSQGRDMLRTHVEFYTKHNRPILFVLPAFPFKSPSLKKVLGVLPDFGEYFAMFALNALCETVNKVYAPGSHMTLVSDGSVYHDMVGVPKEDFQAYQAELRRMGSDFPHLEFKCIKDMMTEEEFTSWSTDKLAFFEEKLVGFDLDAELEKNDNLLQVYKGYLVFMESDLEKQLSQMKTSRSQQKKVVRTVARQLIRRGNVFSRLVERTFPNHVRLSIHCHNNCGPKYAVAIAPSKFKTPWHNTVVLRDGKLQTMKVSEVNQSARIITKDGRPWMMVEENNNADWSQELDWKLEMPFGASVNFKNGVLQSIQ